MTDTSRPAPLSSLAATFGLATALGLGYAALNQSPPTPRATSLGSAPALGPCVMAEPGYWSGQIFGDLVADAALRFDWSGAALDCAGNARPDGRGLRLFFAGRPDGGRDRLLLVIGVASTLAALSHREHAVSVTLVDEASSRFFHTPGERCFAEFEGVTALGSSGEYRVAGELYCAGSIPAVAGPGSVTLGDMRFAGRLTPGEAG